MAQEVIIDFIPDFSKLDTALAELEKGGAVEKNIADSFKAANAEINKQATALKNTSQALKAPIQNLDQLDKKTKSFVKNFVGGFQEGVQEALDEAGVSMKEFTTALEQGGVKAVKNTTSLRQELKNLTLQIAEAKINGNDLGVEYDELVKKAGNLKDAIADAGQEIANAGSDTRGIDNILGSVQALAGGFAIAQGTAALFGDESEDLQKTLLKVNAAMAILQGLQQLSNALQKEGSLIKLADVVATKAQIAVQTIYTAVTGRATAATIGFKVALAATGIGLVVVLVLALVSALKQTSSELERATSLIDQQTQSIEGLNSAIEDSTNIEVARAELIGAKESEIIAIRGKSLLLQRAGLVESNRILAAQRDSLDATSEAWFKLNAAIQGNTDAIKGIDTQLIIANINLQKQQADERKKASEDAVKKAKEAADKALQAAREARAAEFEDFKAKKELELLKTKEGSEEQLEARKAFLRAALAVDLENEKLTTNQKKVLIQKFFKERLQLEKDFGKKRQETILSEIANDLDTELQGLNVSNERKLELTESAIKIAAELEILAAEGNAAKIENINAKMDAAIRAARLASLNEINEREIQLIDANDGAKKRALDRVSGDEKKSAEVRINAIDQLLNFELDTIQRRVDANETAFEKGLISQDEYNLKAAQLADQNAQAHENAEQKKTDITERENEKRKQKTIESIEETTAALSEAVNVLSSLFALQGEAESSRISEQKKQLEDLKEAGAITEKEAITRAKRIEAEEKKLRQRQAQREKTIAVFNALLAIPSAVLKGLAQGGPILAAIYGALAAAQAAIVIARPIPKFATGKKGSYSGIGMVGEAGTEMIERNGQLYVTTKPTITYLGPKDKVFTAAETKRMMPSLNTNQPGKGESIDYDKLAAKIAAAMSGVKNGTPGAVINIDKDFISESVANGIQKNNYFDRYYSSK